eukprot:Trichotokara_eunicae@DN4173_c0_g1_i1.p1
MCEVRCSILWKDELWRMPSRGDGANYLQSTDRGNKELWIRRYFTPTHLEDVLAVRVFGPQHEVTAPDFPTNANRVLECTANTSVLSIYQTLGLKRSPPNDSFSSGDLFHSKSGTPEHIIVAVTRKFSDPMFSEETFPNKLLIELKGRTEKDENLERLARRMIEFGGKLHPYATLLKI